MNTKKEETLADLERTTRIVLAQMMRNMFVAVLDFDDNDTKHALRLLAKPCGNPQCKCHLILPAAWTKLMEFKNIIQRRDENLPDA